MKEICIVIIKMDEAIRPGFYPDLEDTVKQAWGNMLPWFTRRHGVDTGEISLNDGSVKISWQYMPDEEDAP